ncbi:MAG TPA: MinD/ParA family protein [Thermoclostridium caenicola]|uniref:MinD/ParA family protein n=1 Tax=Thermoclostridium caenicola TaxID=659425 RepID=UPI002D053065|nr:MinD/ParA family protein [Thermoclostridium caenicola]HOK42063.1 MinD/ParA family protein [Thermoclostridium caenicola]HOL84706.1 MinD/ParA family protein [Thermoclostridium caenicola]HPO75854.1 MinD/ParA family protein [Thermoclostridium caenicola]
MSDQAEKLRKLVVDLNGGPYATGSLKPEKRARVITVTSGKGGVGKTNITVNLAIALSRLGLRVVILDVDFGLANIDLLFGITPKYTLLDLIREEKSIFEVLTDGPNNIKFLSGGSGVEELISLDRRKLRKFVSNISLLDKLYDVILIDTGAGLSQNVMSFIMAADEIILVTTPEPTSITDAYALVKMVSRRDRRKVIRVLVNMAETVREAEEVAKKLTVVSEKFLSLKLNKFGYILYDEIIIKSVKQQKPFCLSYPRSQAARNVFALAEALMYDSKGAEVELGAKGFIQRVLSFFGA